MRTKGSGESNADVEKPSKAVQGTNAGAAYVLSFSDISNTKRIAEMIRANAEPGTALIPDANRLMMVPYAEARYKAINALLMRSGVKQVVEFAAGLTPRGMNNAQWNFVHTDQDENSLNQIREITRAIISKRPQPMPHFVKFDAISGEGFDDVVAHLRGEPVGIAHVGLFRYYPHESKQKTAALAKRFLERYGGVYITPDIHTRQRLELFKRINPNTEAEWARSSEKMGRDLNSFVFKDNAEAMEILGDRLGLVPKIYKMGQLIGKLSCVPVLFGDPETAKRVEDTIKELEIWQMTLG